MPIKERLDNYPRKTTRCKKKYLMPSYCKRDHYAFYKSDIPHKSKSEYNINRKQFSDIIDLYNVSLLKMLESGNLLQLPDRLGGLQLKKKRANLNPEKDHFSVKKDVLFEDGFWFPMVSWIKKSDMVASTKTANIKIYSFKPTKEFIQKINKLIDKGLFKKLFTKNF